MSMDIEHQNKDESEKQNVIKHPTPLSPPHHLQIVQTPNPLAPNPNSSSLQAQPACGHINSHLAAHTPIQAPRSQAAFSLPTASSSSPPSELIAAEQVPPNLRHHHSESRDVTGISPLARSRSAMEAAKSQSPDSQQCHIAAVQQKQLFSPQPTKHSGGAIGIAMPPQFILNQASPSQGLWPTKPERSAIDDEVGVEMVEANGGVSFAKPCALDSIISDVVESVVQERGLLLAYSGDTSPLAHRNNRGSPSSTTAQHTSITPQRSSRTFFRAPGLEAPTVEAVAGAADSNILVCHVCAFSCSSKFHYNSHMNTHSDHQCPIHQCNYTSRTEGRLRKHVRESHTREQRAAAGIPEPIEAATATTASNDASPTTMGVSNGNTTNLNESLSTTMASIFDMVNRAAPNGNCQRPTSTSSKDTLLKMVDGNGCYNPRQPASALDHIKALTERNLLPTHPVSAEALSGASSMIMMANGGSQTPSSSANDKAKLTPSKRAGKPKSYKCKNCDHISHSKDEQWIHARLHIPPDKQLTCKQCLFVTEYKHHLEYHYRNHAGSKPFQCTHPMCHYQCVNKSMLNSHMKSHTKVYQFKCLDCSYQTKYCHSLKMHLRKYSHRRAPGLHLGSESHEDEEMPESDESGNNTLLQQRLQQGFHQDVFGGIGAAASNTTTSGDEDHPSSSNGSLSKADDANQLAHHPTLNSMLLQPMAVGQQPSSVPPQMVANSGPSTIQQYASHLLLRQQQHAEMMRAAAASLLQCAQCDFQTPNNDEMVRHNIQHLLMGHHQAQQQNSVEHQPSQRPAPGPQALINLYHNLAASQQQQHHHSLPPGVAQAHTPQQSLPNTILEQLLNSGAGSVDLAAVAQFQQELALRLQQQQHHQQQQQRVHEEENRRRAAAVAAALAAAAELHQQQQQQQQQYHHAISVGGSDQSVKTESCYNIQPPSSAAVESTVPITSVTVDDHSHDLHLPPHPHDGSAEDSASPSESKSTTQTDGGTSSGSPSSEATPGGSRMKQRKQSKTSKVDQISVRLQSKCSTPENANTAETGAEVVASSGGNIDIDKRRELNGNALLNSTSTIPSNNANSQENGSNPAVNTLLMHLSHQMQERQRAEMQTYSALQSTRPAGSMPYTCQHCMLGFQDRALYQIHLGYHGYESPFKCNRCGHQSASSLEFNLHLYQAKHD